MLIDTDACWQALVARDRRFEGRFVAAVTSTGIYCRPGCPARTPRRENVRFYPHAAAAQAAGFRPCLRCRPDASPGTPAWSGSSATVARALRLIAVGALDGAPVEALAARLGVGARHLTRLFREHVGATPGAVARTRRAHFAHQLLDETDLPAAEIAFAAGFGSVRRFNEAIREAFHRTPGALRAARRGRAALGPVRPERNAAGSVRSERNAAGSVRPERSATAGGAESKGAVALVLRLPFHPPLDWDGLLDFLRERAIPGVERIEARRYLRTHPVEGGAARISVATVPGASALEIQITPPAPGALLDLVARVRLLFDLDADPAAIGAALSVDPVLGRAVRARPGLRVPGAWDGFELAVRAILGQQVSVRGATTLAGRLVALCGQPVDGAGADGLTHLFPTPAAVAAVDPARLGLPRARAAALVQFAAAVARGEVDLRVGASLEETIAQLTALPGIGPWTAHYLAMRAFGEPDAFPAGDLGIRKALGAPGAPAPEVEVLRRAERWRPWRAYAAMHLWATLPLRPRKDGVRGPPAATALAT
jgi:AraC family transcriptional regulator of adaptative response / DNA-3-methyladenine glycosylase II